MSTGLLNILGVSGQKVLLWAAGIRCSVPRAGCGGATPWVRFDPMPPGHVPWIGLTRVPEHASA
jgi:hypothetical protein